MKVFSENRRDILLRVVPLEESPGELKEQVVTTFARQTQIEANLTERGLVKESTPCSSARFHR